jgi:hypothetical protein
MRAFIAIMAFVAAGCGGAAVDLREALKVEVVKTGWYDVGLINGQNKLVPGIYVRVTNLSIQKLPVLQLNASFRRQNSAEEWGSGFLTVAGSEGLAPGATSGTVFLQSQKGYTGSGESREEMLRNSHFVDAIVQTSAKYGSTQWVRIGEYPIAREMLPHNPTENPTR